MKKYYQIIGWAPVDSGTLMVVDPCYVLPKGDDPDDKPNVNYEEAFEGFFDGDYSKRILAREIAFSGIAGDGVIFCTYDGDGSYPLIALIEESASGTKNICRVTVDLDFSFSEELGFVDEAGLYTNKKRHVVSN